MEVPDQPGALPVLPPGVLAHQPQEGGQTHLAHQEHIQHPVVGHGVGHRHEAAPVVAAVADAQQGGGLFRLTELPHLHRHGAVDPLAEDMLHQGQNIRPPAGDKAQVVISYQGDEIISVNMIDHYRIPWEIALAVMFILALILVAGKTGIRAILSFSITVLMIWKVLVPMYLNGYHPVVTGIIITGVLTVVIISLVYGFERRTGAAVCGAMSGLIVTAVLGVIFTDVLKIHGAIMPYSESLLYSGYADLNLTRIFMASIFIGASGAVIDLSVDITSAVWEVVCKKPDIGWKEATKSGMNVGRAAMGTMTTTLLLAYSGGYVTLMMVFMAQGTPLYNIFNYKYIASEILDTIVGSMGLVSVAPLTALCAGWLLTRGRVPLHDTEKSGNIVAAAEQNTGID